MNGFQVALQVVLPMALMMSVGALTRVGGIVDRPTMKKVDQLVGKVFMPLLMFQNIYGTDFSGMGGGGYIGYAFAGLFALFLMAVFLLPRLIREPASRAAMAQALVRPNYILFGTAVAQSIYGEGNVGIVMLLGALTVPCFNALSVILLELGRSASPSPQKLLVSIAKNQIVIAAAAALALKLLPVRLPMIVTDTITDLASMSTPLSFVSLGVSLDIQAVSRNRRRLILGVAARLVLIPLVLVGGAVALGFRGQELCALFLLFATPTAVASYPMAVSMDADGELAGQMVIFTTLCALPAFFVWVMAMSSFGLF